MRKRYLHIVRLLGLVLLMASCGEEEYYYPSVKLELVTVKSGPDGTLQTLLPDEGAELAIVNDYTGSTISPNSSKRVLSNYEVASAEKGTDAAVIYSLQSVIVLEPKFKGDPDYGKISAKDPVDVVSIWIGRDYLNLILNVKVKGGVQHLFGLSGERQETESAGKMITLSLYHDANGDKEYYNRRAYVSIPLANLVEEKDEAIRIKFKYYTSDKEGNVVESDKYCNDDFEGFEYIPSGINK